MSPYLGPRLRITRRLGNLLGLTRKKPLLRLLNPDNAFGIRKIIPPGQHGRNLLGKKKPYESNEYDFLIRLKLKQRLRFHYGVTEKQLFKYVQTARKSKGSTGRILLRLLEMRLDNIVFRLHMAPTIQAARQLISHGHILVNKKKVNIASYQCQPKDMITVAPKIRSMQLVSRFLTDFDLEKARFNRIINILQSDKMKPGSKFLERTKSSNFSEQKSTMTSNVPAKTRNRPSFTNNETKNKALVTTAKKNQQTTQSSLNIGINTLHQVTIQRSGQLDGQGIGYIGKQLVVVQPLFSIKKWIGQSLSVYIYDIKKNVVFAYPAQPYNVVLNNLRPINTLDAIKNFGYLAQMKNTQKSAHVLIFMDGLRLLNTSQLQASKTLLPDSNSRWKEKANTKDKNVNIPANSNQNQNLVQTEKPINVYIRMEAVRCLKQKMIKKQTINNESILKNNEQFNQLKQMDPTGFREKYIYGTWNPRFNGATTRFYAKILSPSIIEDNEKLNSVDSLQSMKKKPISFNSTKNTQIQTNNQTSNLESENQFLNIENLPVEQMIKAVEQKDILALQKSQKPSQYFLNSSYIEKTNAFKNLDVEQKTVSNKFQNPSNLSVNFFKTASSSKHSFSYEKIKHVFEKLCVLKKKRLISDSLFLMLQEKLLKNKLIQSKAFVNFAKVEQSISKHMWFGTQFGKALIMFFHLNKKIQTQTHLKELVEKKNHAQNNQCCIQYLHDLVLQNQQKNMRLVKTQFLKAYFKLMTFVQTSNEKINENSQVNSSSGLMIMKTLQILFQDIFLITNIHQQFQKVVNKPEYDKIQKNRLLKTMMFVSWDLLYKIQTQIKSVLITLKIDSFMNSGITTNLSQTKACLQQIEKHLFFNEKQYYKNMNGFLFHYSKNATCLNHFQLIDNMMFMNQNQNLKSMSKKERLSIVAQQFKLYKFLNKTIKNQLMAQFNKKIRQAKQAFNLIQTKHLTQLDHLIFFDQRLTSSIFIEQIKKKLDNKILAQCIKNHFLLNYTFKCIDFATTSTNTDKVYILQQMVQQNQNQKLLYDFYCFYKTMVEKYKTTNHLNLMHSKEKDLKFLQVFCNYLAFVSIKYKTAKECTNLLKNFEQLKYCFDLVKQPTLSMLLQNLSFKNLIFNVIFFTKSMKVKNTQLIFIEKNLITQIKNHYLMPLSFYKLPFLQALYKKTNDKSKQKSLNLLNKKINRQFLRYKIQQKIELTFVSYKSLSRKEQTLEKINFPVFYQETLFYVINKLIQIYKSKNRLSFAKSKNLKTVFVQKNLNNCFSVLIQIGKMKKLPWMKTQNFVQLGHFLQKQINEKQILRSFNVLQLEYKIYNHLQINRLQPSLVQTTRLNSFIIQKDQSLFWKEKKKNDFHIWQTLFKMDDLQKRQLIEKEDLMLLKIKLQNQSMIFDWHKNCQSFIKNSTLSLIVFLKFKTKFKLQNVLFQSFYLSKLTLILNQLAVYLSSDMLILSKIDEFTLNFNTKTSLQTEFSLQTETNTSVQSLVNASRFLSFVDVQKALYVLKTKQLINYEQYLHLYKMIHNICPVFIFKNSLNILTYKKPFAHIKLQSLNNFFIQLNNSLNYYKMYNEFFDHFNFKSSLLLSLQINKQKKILYFKRLILITQFNKNQNIAQMKILTCFSKEEKKQAKIRFIQTDFLEKIQHGFEKQNHELLEQLKHCYNLEQMQYFSSLLQHLLIQKTNQTLSFCLKINGLFEQSILVSKTELKDQVKEDSLKLQSLTEKFKKMKQMIKKDFKLHSLFLLNILKKNDLISAMKEKQIKTFVDLTVKESTIMKDLIILTKKTKLSKYIIVLTAFSMRQYLDMLDVFKKCQNQLHKYKLKVLMSKFWIHPAILKKTEFLTQKMFYLIDTFVFNPSLLHQTDWSLPEKLKNFSEKNTEQRKNMHLKIYLKKLKQVFYLSKLKQFNNDQSLQNVQYDKLKNKSDLIFEMIQKYRRQITRIEKQRKWKLINYSKYENVLKQINEKLNQTINDKFCNDLVDAKNGSNVNLQDKLDFNSKAINQVQSTDNLITESNVPMLSNIFDSTKLWMKIENLKTLILNLKQASLTSFIENTILPLPLLPEAQKQGHTDKEKTYKTKAENTQKESLAYFLNYKTVFNCYKQAFVLEQKQKKWKLKMFTMLKKMKSLLKNQFLNLNQKNRTVSTKQIVLQVQGFIKISSFLMDSLVNLQNSYNKNNIDKQSLRDLIDLLNKIDQNKKFLLQSQTYKLKRKILQNWFILSSEATLNHLTIKTKTFKIKTLLHMFDLAWQNVFYLSTKHPISRQNMSLKMSTFSLEKTNQLLQHFNKNIYFCAFKQSNMNQIKKVICNMELTLQNIIHSNFHKKTNHLSHHYDLAIKNRIHHLTNKTKQVAQPFNNEDKKLNSFFEDKTNPMLLNFLKLQQYQKNKVGIKIQNWIKMFAKWTVLGFKKRNSSSYQTSMHNQRLKKQLLKKLILRSNNVQAFFGVSVFKDFDFVTQKQMNFLNFTLQARFKKQKIQRLINLCHFSLNHLSFKPNVSVVVTQQKIYLVSLLSILYQCKQNNIINQKKYETIKSKIQKMFGYLQILAHMSILKQKDLIELNDYKNLTQKIYQKIRQKMRQAKIRAKLTMYSQLIQNVKQKIKTTKKEANGKKVKIETNKKNGSISTQFMMSSTLTKKPKSFLTFSSLKKEGRWALILLKQLKKQKLINDQQSLELEKQIQNQIQKKIQQMATLMNQISGLNKTTFKKSINLIKQKNRPQMLMTKSLLMKNLFLSLRTKSYFGMLEPLNKQKQINPVVLKSFSKKMSVFTKNRIQTKKPSKVSKLNLKMIVKQTQPKFSKSVENKTKLNSIEKLQNSKHFSNFVALFLLNICIKRLNHLIQIKTNQKLSTKFFTDLQTSNSTKTEFNLFRRMEQLLSFLFYQKQNLPFVLKSKLNTLLSSSEFLIFSKNTNSINQRFFSYFQNQNEKTKLSLKKTSSSLKQLKKPSKLLVSKFNMVNKNQLTKMTSGFLTSYSKQLISLLNSGQSLLNINRLQKLKQKGLIHSKNHVYLGLQMKLTFKRIENLFEFYKKKKITLIQTQQIQQSLLKSYIKTELRMLQYNFRKTKIQGRKQQKVKKMSEQKINLYAKAADSLKNNMNKQKSFVISPLLKNFINQLPPKRNQRIASMLRKLRQKLSFDENVIKKIQPQLIEFLEKRFGPSLPIPPHLILKRWKIKAPKNSLKQKEKKKFLVLPIGIVQQMAARKTVGIAILERLIVEYYSRR